MWRLLSGVSPNGGDGLFDSRCCRNLFPRLRWLPLHDPVAQIYSVRQIRREAERADMFNELGDDDRCFANAVRRIRRNVFPAAVIADVALRNSGDGSDAPAWDRIVIDLFERVVSHQILLIPVVQKNSAEK